MNIFVLINLFDYLEAEYNEWIVKREKKLESNQLIGLVKQCLKMKSKLRPEKKDLVNHDFFHPTCETE